MKFSDAEAIFHQALELDSVEKRVKYVQSACGQDEELRSKVNRLLQAHAEAGDFLQTRTTNESPLSEGPGTQIGKFKILEQIGEGGFGVVYMAEQKEPVRRRVALKIIKLGMDTKQVVARFEAERQALALMDHPNIAKILDGGATETPLPASGHPLPSSDEGRGQGEGSRSPRSTLHAQLPSGRPYFVMELVKGRPITKFCDEEKLSTAQRLELFIAVCHAIQHAHQKGVVHRDIKPSNVLVSFVDGRPVPKIIDFGIAKAVQHDLTDKTVFTRFHQFMGTPAYMSPEQAGTDSADIDTRSDLYSLGAILYELLTGRTPMDSCEIASADYDEIRRQIREVEPPRPSNRISTLTAKERTTVAQSRSVEPAKLSRLVRGDLDWIVLKAMEKDRNRRYETANEFGKDLRRYLDNEPVAARKPSMGYVMQKFARRHKAALAAAACFVLLLAVSACVSAAQAIKNKSLFTAAEEARLNEMNAKERETELRRIAETERGKAETERDRSQRLLYVAHMNLAKRAWDEANVGRVVELLDLHRPKPAQEDMRNFEWFYLERLLHGDLLTLKGHTGAVMSVSKVASALNAQFPTLKGHTGYVTSVAVSPDGKRLASAGDDKTVKMWDATTGQELLTLKGHTEAVAGVTFSPDGKHLASVSRDGTVKVWDAVSAQEILSLVGQPKWFNSVVFSPDGKRLASANGFTSVKIWDAANGRDLLTLTGHPMGVTTLAFSPDGKRLASAGYGGRMKVWDAATGEALLTWQAEPDSVWTVAFSPDGKWLASGGENVTEPMKVWDATTGQETLTLKGNSPIFWVAFSPDGKRLVSAGYDGIVRLWDVASGQETLTLKGHTDWVFSVAFFPDGKRLASASLDGTVKIWDSKDREETFSLKGHTEPVRSVAFSPDGKRLASASSDRTVKMWDATSGQETFALEGHTGEVWSVSFSPDGNRLASASADHTVKVWDTTNGREIFTLIAHTDPVRCVAFSPDGKRLASASIDKTVKLWDTTSGQETMTLRHASLALSVAFSPDGKKLASAGVGPTVKVWDTASGEAILTLEGHTKNVFGLAFSPDGKWLASAREDQTVTVWDAASGQESLRLKGHASPIWSVAFSPDGKRLASASTDQTVRVWDVASGQETLTLKAVAGWVWGVVFSPDGNRIASAHDDHSVRIWDARRRSELNVR